MRSSSLRVTQKKKKDFKVDLKSSITRVEDTGYWKIFMYGATGCGTTWGALNILKSPYFKGDLIYINTDIPQNLRDNVKLLSDEEQKRLVIPKDEDGNYYRINEPELWEFIWERLVEEYGDFSGTAGIVIDYIENLYDSYIDRRNPQTPFAYGAPRKEFKREVWDKLMSAKTNVIIIGKEFAEYVDTGKGDQFKETMGNYISFLDTSKSLEKWKVDLNMIIYRSMKFRKDRLKRSWITVFEKHKLGLETLVLDGDDSNLFHNIFDFYMKKQGELKSKI